MRNPGRRCQDCRTRSRRFLTRFPVGSHPFKGLISGQRADLGKFKVPRLSGLASRAPYFHNGNAASLTQLVEFYNTRFGIGLSSQQKQDLVNFLNSL